MKTLRQLASAEASKWCCCDPAFKDRSLMDPQCRCDEWTEAIEKVAREYAELVVRARYAIREYEDADGVQEYCFAYLGMVRSPYYVTRADTESGLEEIVRAALEAADAE
jgi:hypothetical protein